MFGLLWLFQPKLCGFTFLIFKCLQEPVVPTWTLFREVDGVLGLPVDIPPFIHL